MKKYLIGIGILIIIGAGVGYYFLKPPSSDKDSIVFMCDGNKTIEAVYSPPNPAYYNSSDSVSMTLSDGRHLELQNDHLAMGASYSSKDTTIQFVEGGQNDNYLAENGKATYNNCKDPNYR
ncbi:MAG: hypothetical protein V4474_01115 [Patescibacteria group bacterium]